MYNCSQKTMKRKLVRNDIIYLKIILYCFYTIFKLTILYMHHYNRKEFSPTVRMQRSRETGVSPTPYGGRRVRTFFQAANLQTIGKNLIRRHLLQKGQQKELYLADGFCLTVGKVLFEGSYLVPIYRQPTSLLMSTLDKHLI